MIKTKCISISPSKDDGTRICIMRYVKPNYIYDKWIQDLAPSKLILRLYRQNSITWEEFENKYKQEMRSKGHIIDNLKIRSDEGEIITLLCWEKDDSRCHRRLLKEIIENS